MVDCWDPPKQQLVGVGGEQILLFPLLLLEGLPWAEGLVPVLVAWVGGGAAEIGLLGAAWTTSDGRSCHTLLFPCPSHS